VNLLGICTLLRVSHLLIELAIVKAYEIDLKGFCFDENVKGNKKVSGEG
jgi:hypothetical protein